MAMLLVLACMAVAADSFVMTTGRSQRAVMRSSMVDTDALIEELASTAPFDLPAKVSQETVLRTVGRPQFFLRIAELCDSEEDATKVEKYRALADNLSNTLSAVVERAETRMEDAGNRLAAIVAAASEDDGEFLVPLSPEKRSALEIAVKEADIDEAVLSTLNAASKKAESDGMDGVVVILRKVLQLYAANALAFDPETATQELQQFMVLDQEQQDQQPASNEPHPDYIEAIECYTSLMEADEDRWDTLLKETTAKKSKILAIVQAQIERVVLLQENGSFKQRVQAEFLRELTARIQTHVPPDEDEPSPVSPTQYIHISSPRSRRMTLLIHFSNPEINRSIFVSSLDEDPEVKQQ